MRVTQKSGWSPFPAGYQRLLVSFPKNESIAVDKSYWDWTMPSWVIYAYVCLKYNQMVDPEDDRYWRTVWARLYNVFGPGARIREPSGIDWQQTYWGVMKSGSFLTLSLNSAAQESQHFLAWNRAFPEHEIPYMWAMGDDMLVRASLDEDELKLYEHALETTGCKVKKIEYSREFCGFEFVDDQTVKPLYPEKHKFILAHLDPAVKQETILSYELLYALDSLWFKPSHHIEMPLGPLASMWAKGLVDLKVLRKVPDWTDF